MSPVRFCLMGPREFCCGRDRLWNLWETGALDLKNSSVDRSFEGISIAAVTEVAYNFVVRGRS